MEIIVAGGFFPRITPENIGNTIINHVRVSPAQRGPFVSMSREVLDKVQMGQTLARVGEHNRPIMKYLYEVAGVNGVDPHMFQFVPENLEIVTRGADIRQITRYQKLWYDPVTGALSDRSNWIRMR